MSGPNTPRHAPRKRALCARRANDSVGSFAGAYVGTGGKSHCGYATTIVAGSQVRNASTYGVLKLTLHANSYDWKFLPVAGQTFTDSGTTACH